MLDNTDPWDEEPNQQVCNEAETVKKTETSEIQKPGTSGPSDPQAEDHKILTSNPDTETPVIYREIYPQTRSTALLEENPTEIPDQTFEETIIEMFGLPENIKELIPVYSPIPDLTLDLDPALPLEDIDLLDYLNDNNII